MQRIEELEERVGELETEAAVERRRAAVAGESLKILYIKYRSITASSRQLSLEPSLPAPPSYNEGMAATIEQLRARIAELESRPSPPTPPPPTVRVGSAQLR